MAQAGQGHNEATGVVQAGSSSATSVLPGPPQEVQLSANTGIPAGGRASRSCDRCRKLKKVCRGGTPCLRCTAAGSDCLFAADRAVANGHHAQQSHAYSDPSGSVPALLQRLEGKLTSIAQIAIESQERLARLETFLIESGDSIAQNNGPHQLAYTAPPSPDGEPLEGTLHDGIIGDIPDHRMHLPKQAIFDAAATMPQWAQSLSNNARGTDHAVTPDVVSKGLMSLSQAYDCVNEFLTRMYEFCAVVHPSVDTFEGLRASSTFLFHTVVYLGARSLPNAEVLRIAMHEAHLAWQEAMTMDSPTTETVQALALWACWHDESYITVGVAMRMALHLRWHLLTNRFSRDDWASNREDMRPRVRQLRTWLLTQFLDNKHSISTDRPMAVSDRESFRWAETADYLLLSPFCTPADIRCVANLHLCIKHRNYMQVARERRADWAVDKAWETFKKELHSWHAHYDALLVARGYGADSWQRLSHRRHLHDSCMLLTTMLYQKALLRLNDERSAGARSYAFESAQNSVRTVLDSIAYSCSIKHSGYSTRVELTFACLLIMKFHKLDQASSKADIIQMVTSIADLLKDPPGWQRHEELLRFALHRFCQTPNLTELQMMQFQEQQQQNQLQQPDMQHQQYLEHTLDLSAAVPAGESSLEGLFAQASNNLDYSWLSLDSWLSDYALRPDSTPTSSSQLPDPFNNTNL